MKSYNQACNIAQALEIVGDRWTLLIIRDMLHGKKTFSELKESLQGIPPNLLSDRLQHLEQCGVVAARMYSAHPPRYEYSLTASGLELRKVIDALAYWGTRFTSPRHTELVHKECGHEVEITYHCPHCQTAVKDVQYRRVPR
jgi:DNA-binding HxlR family transcriptional regulator